MTNQSKSAAGPAQVSAALKNNIGNFGSYVGMSISINVVIVNVALIALATVTLVAMEVAR